MSNKMKSKLTYKQELEVEKYSCEECIKQMTKHCDAYMDYQFIELIVEPLQEKIKEIDIKLNALNGS
jgi:hypothetical protein